MRNTLKKGFTLIELLVVITIIWILATGATTIYTSQIQKARDTVRLNDVKAIQSAVEQVYQDASIYPSAVNILKEDHIESILTYMWTIPRDRKNNQTCASSWTTSSYCWYAYIQWPDDNNMVWWAYELSNSFENKWNLTSKAAEKYDSWDDDSRYETWLNVGDLTTKTSTQFTNVKEGACTIVWATAWSDTTLVIINGKSTTTNSCSD